MLTRRIAKRLIESVLVHSGATAIVRRSMRGRALVLAYHNIVPDDAAAEGDLPNHLPLATFTAQLDAIATTHDVVPLDRLLEPTRSQRRPEVAITFDDAYRGAVTLGVPALIERGFPATIFVAPGLLGGQSFWWDEFAVFGTGLTSEFRHHALVQLAGDGDAIRASRNHAGVRRATLTCPYRVSATEEELQYAASLRGISLGSHTWSHPALTEVSHERLSHELRSAREWLLKQEGHIIDAIAYPYGATDERVMAETRAAGYRVGFRVDGGWLRPPLESDFGAPRLNVDPGLSANGFALRLAGILAR